MTTGFVFALLRLQRDTFTSGEQEPLCLTGFSPDETTASEVATRGLAAEAGVKPGALMGAARVALTGQAASPGMFDGWWQSDRSVRWKSFGRPNDA